MPKKWEVTILFISSLFMNFPKKLNLFMTNSDLLWIDLKWLSQERFQCQILTPKLLYGSQQQKEYFYQRINFKMKTNQKNPFYYIYLPIWLMQTKWPETGFFADFTSSFNAKSFELHGSIKLEFSKPI